MKVWAIVLAAGAGNRFGGAKQYEDLGGETVLARSVRVASGACAGVVVVLPPRDLSQADLDEFDAAMGVNGGAGKADAVAAGGSTRSDSVRAGLAAIPQGVTHVLVHDAARPCASTDLYDRVIHCLKNGAQAVIPGVPVTDTIKRVRRVQPVGASVSDFFANSGPNHVNNASKTNTDAQGALGRVVGTVDREELVAVQTPQGFEIETLRDAHQLRGDATDDAGLVEALGVEVQVVEGEKTNIKITSRDDLEVVRMRLAGEQLASTDNHDC